MLAEGGDQDGRDLADGLFVNRVEVGNVQRTASIGNCHIIPCYGILKSNSAQGKRI